MSYAQALYSLSEDENVSFEVYNQISSVRYAFSDNPGFSKILDRPGTSQKERDELIDRCFSGINVFLLNCIKVMSKRRVCSCFTEMADEFIKLYQAENGIEPVTVITAVELTDDQVNKLKGKLEEILDKEVFLTKVIDKQIIGGIIVRTTNSQFDYSVKSRLEDIGNQLKSSAF